MYGQQRSDHVRPAGPAIATALSICIWDYTTVFSAIAIDQDMPGFHHVTTFRALPR